MPRTSASASLLPSSSPRPEPAPVATSPREAKNLGTELLVAGDLEGALAAFQEAVTLAPEDVSCRQKVAEVLQRLGRIREATAEYEAAARLWDEQGWMLRAMGLCKVILQLDPDHPRAAALLADLRARRGLPEPGGEAPPVKRLRPHTPPRVLRPEVVAQLLRPHPLFSRLEPRLLLLVAEAFKPHLVDAGEPILMRGDPARALYLLLRGRCEVFHQHLDGHESAYPDLIEGDVFGEVALLRSKLVTASVRAKTACLLLKLDRQAFEQLVSAEPELRRDLQRLGAERLCRTALLLTRSR
ncbi:cyclic nucleotide-binding domain-containing protein [Pyxidicoccus parkwayensis]|uniref:Cyclic nucleotide-binding domain-containing protein n=1 Tax=Pyxidicoccus parkwayensis TaxID=2813578 RepID=A0ABX7P7B9_9BACT|nr:cyclic nucleotide-binding domain-containing protein [Pyxidicoccus parkwaysis]QSQ26360.1 cyclic nucleotide-binding domain-containing protein [Pyxidicoccus parkwaysis]